MRRHFIKNKNKFILEKDKFDKNIPVDELKLNEKLPDFKSQNKTSIGQLFYGFLEYYSKFK